MKKKEYFNKIIMGSWFLFEKDDSDCQCSYCSEERRSNKKIGIILPECKVKNSWRIIFIKTPSGHIHLRRTGFEWSYFFGFTYMKWDGGFRLTILPLPIHNANDNRGLITICPSSPFKTKIKGIECLFWKSLIGCESSGSCVACGVAKNEVP